MNLVFYLKQPVRIVLLSILLQKLAFAQKGENGIESNEALRNQTVQPLEAYEYSFPSMGTMVQLIVYAADTSSADTACRQAEQLTGDLSAILSDYDPDSETRRLSQSASVQAVPVSEPLWQVLQAADRWNHQSHGALDCSLGTLTSLWRKYRRANRVPTRELIESSKSDTGWQNICLNQADRTIQISSPRIRLDFGAIGKGYIVDRIYEVLQQHGLSRCLVNISGNMRMGDAPPGREHWKIAISPLEPQGEPIRYIGLAQSAVATSGDLWQFSIIEGEKRSHVLDPKTGYGVPGPLSVTAISPTAIDADALATIGCILDWKQFDRLVESQKGRAALRAVMADGELETLETSEFPAELVVQD